VPNPGAGFGSYKLSFTIRDFIENTINLVITLPSCAQAKSLYNYFKVMETV
jgi:hypothetical protein